MAYAQHNQCGCQKRLVSSWEDKRGKVMAPARSNSAIMHVQVQCVTVGVLAAPVNFLYLHDKPVLSL
jgi:hypothetical protein